MPQLEPRSFSFNSPYGACQTCHGLGSQWSFDPARVIADPSKPLLDGGLSAGSSSSLMLHHLNDAAKKFRIKIEKPFEDLSEKHQKLLMDGGTGFAGILKLLQQLYDESPSEDYRAWLLEQMTPAKCPECKGARLRASSLSVRVKEVSIADFTHSSVARLIPMLEGWKLSEREEQIAGRVLGEIRNRLQFLSAVGWYYPSLDRSSATLSGV